MEKIKLQMFVEANEVRKKHRLLLFSSNWHLYPLMASRIISFHTWKLLWPFPLTRQYPRNVRRLWFSGRHIKSLRLALSSSDIDVTEGAFTLTEVKRQNHKPAQSTYILDQVLDDVAAMTQVKQLRGRNQEMFRERCFSPTGVWWTSTLELCPSLLDKHQYQQVARFTLVFQGWNAVSRSTLRTFFFLF